MKLDFKYLKKKLTDPRTLLILILILGLFLRMYFFVGIGWKDTPAYLGLANRVLEGDFYLGSYVTGMRIMMIYPIAFFYLLFGIGTFSAVLYPLLTGLGSIIIIYYLGKELSGEKVGLLSAFFLGIFPLHIIFSTWPMPDVPITFFLGLSVLLLLKSENMNNIRNKRLLLLFSGLVIGISYLVKVSSLQIMLFILPYLLYKFIKRGEIDFDYSLLFLGIFIILLLEGTFYSYHTDHLFVRLNEFSNHYKDMHGRSGLNFYPLNMFNLRRNDLLFNFGNLKPNFGFFYYFIFLSFAYLLIKRKFLVIFFWFALIFLYRQFGTMDLTFSHYNPIHRAVRHLLPLTIPALLCLSEFFKDILDWKKIKKARYLIFIFGISFLLITSLFYTNKRTLYENAQISDHRKIYEYLKNYPNATIYTTGTRNRFQLRFRFGFENNKNIKSLSEVKDSKEIENSFVVLNASRPFVIREQTPSFVNTSSPNWELVKIIKGPEIAFWSTYNPKIYFIHPKNGE